MSQFHLTPEGKKLVTLGDRSNGRDAKKYCPQMFGIGTFRKSSAPT